MPAPPASPPLPGWTRFADLLCLLLIVLAVVVALSGGFRLRVGGVRIALTSADRIAMWAAALAIVRHLVVRRSPIYRDIPKRVAAAWRTSEVRTAVAAVIGTRVPILFVGYMAIFMIGFPDRVPFRVSPNEFLNLQARWDSGWYLGIASGGYTYGEGSPQVQRNIVFFPALPALMRVAGRLFGGASVAFLMGGTLIAIAAFMWALVYLYRLARSMLDADDRAQYAVWLLAAYPFALFYSAVYTESIFLLAAVGAFYHLRRGEFVRCGCWGLLAGLTRPNGCFLAIPLALLALGPWLPRWLRGGSEMSDGDRAPSHRIVPALAAAAMPGVGVLLYSAFIWRLTGDPLAWAEGHVAWGRSYQGLSILVVERYEYLVQEGLYAYTSQLSNDLLQAIGPIFVLAAVWGVTRRLGFAYAVFILINILPPLAAGGLLSAGRFSSVIFPAFIWFASVVPAGQRSVWLAIFMALQAFNASLFYTWRPMY
jgi:hypothetical protein